MKLNIKNLKGQQFWIQAQLADCVFDLKNRIKQLKSIDVDKQKLVYKGKVMEDKAIISDMGVKDQDNIVLMNIVAKKQIESRQNKAVEAKKVEENKGSLGGKVEEQPGKKLKVDEKSVDKLVKLGYERKIAQQALLKADNNLEKAIQQQFQKQKAQGKQYSPNQILKHEMLKSLIGNQKYLQMTQKGQLQLQISNIEGLFEHNEKLQQLLLQNPNALNQLLLNDQQGDDFDYDGEQENQGQGQGQQQAEQYIEDIVFTQDEEKAIQRLVDLGFDRDRVIEAYLACDRNQEMAADMLFNQKDNVDFD